MVTGASMEKCHQMIHSLCSSLLNYFKFHIYDVQASMCASAYTCVPCVCIFEYPYLKIGELGVVEVRVDVQGGAHHQQRLKLVQ